VLLFVVPLDLARLQKAKFTEYSMAASTAPRAATSQIRPAPYPLAANFFVLAMY
jgi:hypothetical protein